MVKQTIQHISKYTPGGENTVLPLSVCPSSVPPTVLPSVQDRCRRIFLSNSWRQRWKIRDRYQTLVVVLWSLYYLSIDPFGFWNFNDRVKVKTGGIWFQFRCIHESDFPVSLIYFVLNSRDNDSYFYFNFCKCVRIYKHYFFVLVFCWLICQYYC
jgi:hypothetical protein